MASILKIQDLSLSFPHKVCFENFSTSIYPGNRIAIIGRNGSGKSSLLKMIAEIDPNITSAYVPQIITDFDLYSGGERFNKALSGALSKNPDLLLLDEPTNHLDLENRRSFLQKLQTFQGILIIVTHDKEVLRYHVDILWHVDNGKITIFQGKYDDYIHELQIKRQSIVNQIDSLKHQKQESHQKLMKEQEHIAKSKASGKKKLESKKWMRAVYDLKGMKAEIAQGSKLRAIDQKKQDLSEQLAQIRLPEVIVPNFSLSPSKSAQKMILSISDGAVGYGDKIILSNIYLSISSSERVAVRGRNGSGKTTLIKGILNDISVKKTGEWNVPSLKNIGTLDQHYQTLFSEKSALEIISDAAPTWDHAEIRRHLNSFLFRKNEEVNECVKNLSGGERARLSLAQIAANPPKLLILDEITNNLDLETRYHIAQILRGYPGAMLVISHDLEFINEINIEMYYDVEKWKLKHNN